VSYPLLEGVSAAPVGSTRLQSNQGEHRTKKDYKLSGYTNSIATRRWGSTWLPHPGEG